MTKENETLLKQLESNTEGIQSIKAKILLIEERKNKEIFDYQRLIDDKINGVEIKSISVHGCQCLRNIKCDNMHNIHIYDTLSEERINFNNEKKFTIEELEKLNYTDKLKITVSDGSDYKLRNGCALAKYYPKKVVVYCYGYD